MGSARLVPELYCSDIEQSLRFYVEVLGFAVAYRRGEDGFAFLDRDGAQLMIEEIPRPERRLLTAELTPPFGRGMNLQIEVENVDAVLAAVTGAGFPTFWPLEEHEYRRGGGSVTVRQFVVADPDGYLLRLSQIIGHRTG